MAIIAISGRIMCCQYSSDTLVDHGLKLGTGDRSGGSRVCDWKRIFKKRNKKKAKHKQIQAREGKNQVKSKSIVI
ncbi:hypothetical protein Tco_0467356, partial [Tanacetum coccineum]